MRFLDLDYLDAVDITIDGSPAHKVVYTGADGYKGMEIWIVRDGIGYDLVYTSQVENEYEFFLDTAQRMIDSFEITAPPSSELPFPSVPTQFSTYEDTDYGVNLLYPSDWIDLGVLGNTTIAFTAPGSLTGFGVRVFEDSSEELQDYINFSMEFLEDSVTGLNILESEETLLDGNDAYRVVYTGAGGSKVMEVWTLKEGIAYDLVYTSYGDEYDVFLGTAQRMIDSFDITSSRPPALFSSEPDDFPTYEDADYGISTLYPSNWRSLEYFGNTVVTFLAPGGRTSFEIVAFDWLETVDGDYVEASRDFLEDTIDELSILRSEDVMIDGNDAYTVIYTGADGLRGMQTWITGNEVAYDLIYTSDEGEYDLFIDTAQRVIDSFQITSSRPPALFPSKPTEFSIYENTDYGISTMYPTDWINVEDIDNTVVTFFALNGITSFGISTFDAPSTFEDYVEASFNLLDDTIADSLMIVSSEDVMIGGNDAHIVVYTGADGLKGMQVWIVNDGIGYDLVYTSNEDEYEFFLDAIQRMIDSFKITPLQSEV